MKKIAKLFFAAAIAIATSCNTDFMNVAPRDRLTDAVVWSDPALVEAFVNEMYRGLNHGIRELMVGSLADESHFIHNYGSAQVVQSILTPADIGAWGRGDFDSYRWTELYRRIRQVNMFFENIDDVPFDNESWRQRMKGEVHFLNAYFYHNLVRLHGGVPIIDRTFELSDEFLVERSSLADCIDYIVSECDNAAALLPLQHPDEHIGRATKG